MTLHIVLADDHAVLRAGLRALLDAEEDLEVVGEASDGVDCVDLVTELRPDVVVLDINMPRCNGLEALERIRSQAPATRVLALTMHDEPEYLRQVLTSGGAGFVLKQFAAEELLSAIRAVGDGGVYVHPRHAKVLLDDSLGEEQPAADDKAARHAALSDREAEIFRLTALGHRNAEIAEMLGLSVKTVETYRARMMNKLGIETRAELVRLALELGVLS